VVDFFPLLIFNWSSACYHTMIFNNFSQNMLGQDYLHKGSSCEMETLVDLVVGNEKWPSGTWIKGSE